MKKLSRIAALLAAGALLFGAFGCSDDDNEEKDPPKPQTETVSYTLEDDTPGFDSGSLKVSGMNTTEDTSDDTFEMTLTPTGGTAVKVEGTWELTSTGFVCKPTENVTINGITVTTATGATGTANADYSEITLKVSDEASLTFVKSTGNGGGDGDKATATEASWNLVGTSADKDAGKKTYGGLEFNGTDVKLMAGNINADTGNLKIVIGSTGKGTAAAAGDKKKTIGDGLGATSANTYARFKPSNVQKGLVFKFDAITIPDVKGKVKLTIECFNNKAAGTDHQLDVIYGDTVESEVLPGGGTDSSPETLTYNLDFAEATPVYISTSEEIFFRTIKIEAVN